jgi:hypothetical protein
MAFSFAVVFLPGRILNGHKRQIAECIRLLRTGWREGAWCLLRAKIGLFEKNHRGKKRQREVKSYKSGVFEQEKRRP